MFITAEDHIKYLHELISQRPKNVYIATFNIFAGIMFDGADINNWGAKYNNEMHGVLDNLQDSRANTRILVGIPDLIPCRPGCESCLEKYVKLLTRTLKHAEKWAFNWKYVERFHMKSYIFDYGDTIKGVVGGRNLTTSNYADLTFKIGADKCKVIRHIFNRHWDNSKEITQENINNTILEQMDYLNKE